MLMFGKQLTAEQRLTKAVVDIMGNNKYFALSGVLMMGSRTVRDDLPTACTNGLDEMYGRGFIEQLNDAELRFVVLHECYHKLYRHLLTWRHLYDEDAMCANAACDYVINIKIADDNTDGFATMPIDRSTNKPKGLLDEKYRGMDTAQVYRMLKEDAKNSQGSGNGDGSGGSSGSGASSGTSLDDHDWDGAKRMNSEERKQLERELDEAIRQGALAAGKMGSGGNRALDELLASKIDWREALREFITDTCTGNDYSTWRRPSRRFISSGHYMPSGVTERVRELVVAIDTSGSIGGRELSQFLGEVEAICQTVRPERVRVLYWDTNVCADEVYDGEQISTLTKSTKPAGGGGTTVSCVPAYMQEHSIAPQAVIVLTDGYLGGNWGTWSMPVLWCILNNARTTAPVGKTIHVKD